MQAVVIEEAGNWGHGQFRNPEEGKWPLLGDITKQSNEDCDWEHEIVCGSEFL
jgi:hypothetical protein